MLALFTGGSRTEVLNILNSLKLIDEIFQPMNVVTKQDNFPPKPSADAIQYLIKSNNAESTVYIGDTKKDYEVACNAGINFVYIGKRKLGVAQIKDLTQLNVILSDRSTLC